MDYSNSGSAEFLSKTWEDGGVLPPLDPEIDKFGHFIPKYRVINPGSDTRKTPGYMYLIVYGIVEEKNSLKDGGTKRRTFASFPLGVGKSTSHPQILLDAIVTLDITVRRTAGSSEMLVYGTSTIPSELTPWKNILTVGALFPAIKVCSNVDMIDITNPQRFRPTFLTITTLTDAGVYKVPKTILDFRMPNAVALNLLVELQVGTDLSTTGIKGVIDKDGNKVTTFMIHLGNFVRRNKKEYSVAYCKQKVDKMDLRFSLGAVGGLSFHVKVAGKMSKTLKAQLGYKSCICYSLMDTNPYLNKIMWQAECSIKKVTAVFQPSVPKEYKIYDDVLVDHTGKIMK
uniref:Matrix protein n=1 Tax=Dendromus rat paramyxovirus TaxID=3141873 RepID=A0AAU7E4E1_9MONO